ncbi:hypothetical protein TNCV_4949421 [Trichonephila clavipes]|nr:hypothetical protein TNCV_4949421 [Trichonephila clavipes]
MEAYFFNGRSVIAVQRAFPRHFDIPGGCVPDRKCVLMWIYAFRAMENVSKERKDLRRPLEHLKMWNEFVCQFISIYDNDLTILTRSPRKGS